MGQNNDRLLHITIGAQPSQELNLDQEVRLVKAGLLYADQVRLYSLTSSILNMTSRFGTLPIKYKVDILQKALPLLFPNRKSGIEDMLRNYKKTVTQEHLTNEDLALKKQVEDLLNSNWNGMEEETNKIIQNSKTPELKKAIDAGILELHSFENAHTDEDVVNFMIESLTNSVNKSSRIKGDTKEQGNKLLVEFIEKVFTSISDGSTYPLFDEGTASLVQAKAGTAKPPLSESGVDRGKQTGLIKRLFEYLPTFEEASIDEILDIRRELEKPLVNFRSAIINFSEDIKSAGWDKDFLPEADKIYHRDIRPAMLEIDERVKSNKFLTTLIKKVAEKPAVLPTGSLLSMAISQFSSLPKEFAASLGVGVASASLIYEAYEEWKKKKQDTEKNLLYFYYGVDKQLKK